MATHAPITGAPTRAPAIHRRKLLAWCAIAPAAAIPLALPVPASAAGVSAGLRDKMVAVTRAQVAHDQHSAAVYKPLKAAFDRRRADAAGQLAPDERLKSVIGESNALCDAWADAEGDVVAFPAASLNDLLAKLEFMVERRIEHDDWTGEHILTDVRRLTGRA